MSSNLEQKLGYSFDDEPVSKFCYGRSNRKLEIYFNSYYDLVRDEYIEAPCIWTIENWEYAKSKIGDEQKLYDLDRHLGIFWMIFYLKYNDDGELEMLVNTVDDRYVTLFFKGARLSLK
jgi:hypothetical protein